MTEYTDGSAVQTTAGAQSASSDQRLHPGHKMDSVLERPYRIQLLEPGPELLHLRAHSRYKLARFRVLSRPCVHRCGHRWAVCRSASGRSSLKPTKACMLGVGSVEIDSIMPALPPRRRGLAKLRQLPLLTGERRRIPTSRRRQRGGQRRRRVAGFSRTARGCWRI